jgi:hypothetical protein
MEIRAKCYQCGKELTADQPEGTLSAVFTCDCGQSFVLGIIIEPFGKAFLYAIEATRRRRYSNACIQFATSFEVFQKQCVELLLRQAGIAQSLARFLTYDLDLPREKYSRIVGHILHTKLKHPDVSLRNFAVHFGRIPVREKVLTFAEDVLQVIDDWIVALAKKAGSTCQLLIEAYTNMKPLPQVDVSEFERRVFDLRAAHILLRDQWISFVEEGRIADLDAV